MHRHVIRPAAAGLTLAVVLGIPGLQPRAGALPAPLPPAIDETRTRQPGPTAAAAAEPARSDSSGEAQIGARPTPSRWAPPLSPARVVAPFQAPEARWSAGHRGIDLVARPGQEVRAAGTGQVAFAGPVAGRGVLSIDHGGLRTTYEPVSASVVPGQWVDAGDPVGTVGTGTGHCGSGRCLHLGLRRGADYLDPMLLWGRTATRLRPW
jgi:murein DD-endopeptidase MepM/ murein hydrolase activator NlpD